MLVLSTLHRLLSQILTLPDLHTAVLLTTEGQLVSVASDPSRSKDDILVAVGLGGEIWKETQGQGYGMVDSELGRLLVLPVKEIQEQEPKLDDQQPLMLLALNSTEAVEWDELHEKGKALASHLAKQLCKFREHLAIKTSKPPSAAPSPNRPR